MKRILPGLLLFTIFLTGICNHAQSQVFNNEWIDYSKSYYKFTINPQAPGLGLQRIPQSVLAASGLQNVPAEQFQLWRDGKQVPIYTSVATGIMTSSDYIEFWGDKNDGKSDNVLYRQPEFQMNDKWSLQTDTAAYFLTINSGPNFRLQPTTNNVAGNTLSTEPYFMYTAGMYFKDKINAGQAAVVVEYLYSSSYDQGEGWTSLDITPTASYPSTLSNLFPYTGAGAPGSRFRVNVTGNAMNPRNFVVKINGDSVYGQELDFFDYVKADGPMDISVISTGSANVNIINECTADPTDRIAAAQYEIYYPRLFNFAAARNFPFTMPASATGNYIEITNFNNNFTVPVLYDLTNGQRYVAEMSGSGSSTIFKFALSPSATERNLVLVAEDAANAVSVTSMQKRNFANYGLPANQGNYLIITNPILTSGATHPVDDYRAYRSSVAGGAYNAKVYMIDELVDQFGFGVKKNPLSVRNFIRWARATYSSPLKDVLLIGKGVTYDQYRVLEGEPGIEQLNLVPTFGSPASDNLLAAEPGPDEIPKTPIGRLSVISPDEVSVYLTKVKEYEQAQAFMSPAIIDKAWMKDVMHVVGASDTSLQATLDLYMNQYKAIIIDTFYGANVSTFSKSSADAVQAASSAQISTLFHQGIGMLTYFGHSSQTSLEFNLDNPSQYSNQGKYPVMIALGCNAGNLYNYTLSRFQALETLSEKFTLAPEGGTIAFIASSHFQIVHYCDILNSRWYTAAATTFYGRSLGEIMIEATRQVYNYTTQNDFYARFHCEQQTLHGDPAIKLNSSPKPDYVIEDQLVKVSPSFISVADTSFRIDAKFMNIGKAINQKIVVEVKRTYPDLSTAVIRRDTIPGIRFIDSLTYSIPIVATRDKGLNKITITVDADNAVDEIYETNNSTTKDVFIYEDEARPVYPYNFAIVNKQGIKLQASTADAFSPLKQYIMEMDTTELFNSASKISSTISSTGGLLSFTPPTNFVDSTVYYWRVAPVPVTGQPIWNTSSFVYLAASDFGFNQSHLYQHFKSGLDRMILDSTTRRWTYKDITSNLFVRSGVFPSSFTQAGSFSVAVNGDPYIRSVCGVANIVFNVFDPVTFKPWKSPVDPNTTSFPAPGLYGCDDICDYDRVYNFQFNIQDTAKRRKIVQFLDLIPDGYFVVARNCSYQNDDNPVNANTYVSTWKGDTSYLGHNNSIYHRLLAQGFTGIDSFYRSRAFVFIYKKNNRTAFTPEFIFSDGIYDPITLSADCLTPDSLGHMTSQQYGPAKGWKQLKWRGTADNNGDIATVDVIGIKNDGTQSTLYAGVTTSQQDFDISAVNAVTYPYIKLKLNTMDSVNHTPYQLRYWRVTYLPAPEGAIAPNVFLQTKDTLEVGEPLNFKVAFKNISDAPFDSVKVKMIITDKNNVSHTTTWKRRPMPVNDTIDLSTQIATASLSGVNTMYIEANPDADQPEQYHFNNFAYRNFYVKPDSLSPLLDVTFDGVHILNRDIVSSKPDIVVKLKDEAKWLILDDTSLLTVQVQFPNGSIKQYYFNNDTLRFTPAGQAPNPDNTATVNFMPYFTQDGDYELIVTGKDKTGNTAGSIQYRVAFQVINKPMISNMLNYPNPFTTSTAFVFTITGSEVPQNIKIEIMTITGKIVREITKEELGPLHIGRNITEFKWDGTDQFGQKVGNGIYLYRVVTNLNGKKLDKYTADGDNTDKYFNKGYGKMVLMR